jgi:chloramphenicol-sensitive protein RarD
MAMDPATADRHARRVGVASALAAFLFWGTVPFYFKALSHVGAWEIITHRIIWALPVLALFLFYRDGRQLVARLRLPPRIIGGLFLSSLLVSANWLIYVWAVVNDRVLSTSLGYFINPLVNVLLGYLFLQERLTPYQKIAVALAAAGTLYLGWFLGQPPWISLTLGFLFGAYGLVRKRLSVGPMTGLMWEIILLMPLGLAYLLYRNAQGQMDFLHGALDTDMLLLLAGLVTVLPLIWFNMAAQRLPLSVVGFFMYIAPTMTFLLAVFVWGEPFTQGHAVAFGCIWIALGLISVESLNKMRRERRLRRLADG